MTSTSHFTRPVRGLAGLGRTLQRRRTRRVLGATTTVLLVGALLNAGPAGAATPTLTLTAANTPGSPAVTFTVSVAGAATTDTGYLCFGDSAPALCDASHPGTAVDLTAASAPGGTAVAHTYPAEGSYTATFYEVQGTTVTPSTPAQVAVTIDATARLTSTTAALAATFDGATSTFSMGETWWGCFGDNQACTATAPDASGTIAAGQSPMHQVSHTYAKPGTYPASLTIVGPNGPSVATSPVTASYPDPTAVLTASTTTGSGSLPVTFDGSQSGVGAGDTWALCYGDVANCTQQQPDVSGSIAAAGATVQLPNTPHTYGPGNYTATLWVAKGTTTTSSQVGITVTNAIAGPDSTCSAAASVRTCTLFAKGNGTVTVGSGTGAKHVPIWGFTLSDSATPVLGGPELVATEGETLKFVVSNELDPKAGAVSITVPALMGAPDLTGVNPGATGPSGSFTLAKPGTYVYEAGLTAGGERQVAMGMSGVLIVRPSLKNATSSARCAYDPAVNSDCVTNKDPNNYFDREKLVVVNEVDPAFNADPFGTDTAEYNPSAFFVDGVAYDSSRPALDPTDLAFNPAVDNVRLDVARGDTVLLRYADLGLREHSMNLMGVAQTETARDAHLLPGTHAQQTEFLSAGETADTFLTVPADATAGMQFPLLDAGFHLNNVDAGGIGGMYTYLNVVNGAPAGDIGPVGSDATADPTYSGGTTNTDNGQIPTLAVSGLFTAQAPATGPTPTVASVRWALDGVPAAGGVWQSNGAAPSPAGATTARFSFTLQAADLSPLLAAEPDRIFGDHTIWLQAIDSAGHAGPPIGASFTMARRDAVISTLSLDPKVTNGNTASAQGPVASTTVTSASNGKVVNGQSFTLNVASTAGFPADCLTANLCTVTIRMTIGSGPAQGDTVPGQFTYTGLTPTTLTGVVADSAAQAGAYTLSTGSTVALDVVPAGYVGVDATATAALPGWVVSASQACVVLAASGETAPTAAEAATCSHAPNSAGVTDLTLSTTDSLAAVSGFIAPPKLPAGVVDGAHYWVLVSAQEGPAGVSPCDTSTCRWSPWLYIDSAGAVDPATYEPLTVVKQGPTTATPLVSPNPSNGIVPAAGNLGLVDSFDVTATSTSAWANISLAEVFIADTTRAVGAAAPAAPTECVSLAPNTPTGCVVFGQGAEMTPADGFWNNAKSKTETAYLPLSQLQGMKDGLLQVWVHARDEAGNWGPFTATDLVLDTAAPAVDSLTPQAPNGTRTLTAHDVVPVGTGSSSGIVAAEWFAGADPGTGNATPVTLTAVAPSTLPGPKNDATPQKYTVRGLPSGPRTTISIRVVDAAGNWSTALTVVGR